MAANDYQNFVPMGLDNSLNYCSSRGALFW
jgi:hypothetical protein